MSALRVRHLFIAALAVGAVAVLPATAGAHPEACAATGAFSELDGRRLGRTGPTEPEGCTSTAAIENYDDSGATLAAGETDGTTNLTLLSNTPKPAPFETETDFNSDLAFENGYAFGGNYDGVQIWDVRDGQTPALASVDPLPGLAERRHGQRRHPRHLDRLAPHQRLVRERGDDHAERSRRRGRA